MNSLSIVVLFLAGCAGFRRSQRRARVAYRPCREMLETKTLQSQLLPGAHAVSASLHEHRKPVPGSAEIHSVKGRGATKVTDAATSHAHVHGTHPVKVAHLVGAGAFVKFSVAKASTTAKLAPKDPGGIELVRTLGSVQLSPKDSDGVTLGKTIDTQMLATNDPGQR